MSDIEHKLMAKKENQEKRDRKLKDQEDRLREINNNLRKKNLCVIGIPEGAKMDRGQSSYLNKS